MKKTILLSCLMCMMAMCAKAQLEVQESGKVMIGGAENQTALSTLSIGGVGMSNSEVMIHPNNKTGLTVNSTPNYPGIKINLANPNGNTTGNTVGLNIQLLSNLGSQNSKSIYICHGATQGISYGVYSQYINILGVTAQASASIYGCSHTGPSSLISGNYAGYFDGDVKVAGNGVLYAHVLSPSTTSATSNKEVKSILLGNDELVSEKLEEVQVVRLERERYEMNVETNDELTLSNDLVLEEIKPQTQLASIQYGLDTDQLREVYPELVYEDQNGNISVNYIEMIPLMLHYINELNARIKILEGGGERVGTKQISHKVSSVPSLVDTDGVLLLSLGQNDPNPFSEQTSIEVSVPESVTSAALLFFDMQGKQVKRIDISDRGTSRITVMGQGLPEGMYLYSLVADGKVVKTRKMILSK